MSVINSLINNLTQALAAPKEHAKELLIIAAIALIFLAVIFFLIRIIRQRRKHGKAVAGDLFGQSDITKKSRIPQLLFAAAVLLALAILFGFHQTSQPSSCANCHEMKPYYSSWQKSRHKNVGCLNCHQQPGAFGYLIGKAQILRDVSLNRIYFARSAPIISDPINSDSCRSCHQKISDLTLNGIRVSHKQIAETDFPCVNCHSRAGHALSTRPKIRVMDQCLICHDGVKAPNKCGFCHVKDLGYRKNQMDDYSKTDLADKGCDTCHPQPDCLGCHNKTRQLRELLN